jgi:hypothetical protein
MISHYECAARLKITRLEDKRGGVMNELKWDKVSFSLTDLALVGVLRFVSGFGLGLLLAESISKRNRKRLGWSLFMGSIAVGAPLGIRMLRGDKGGSAYMPARRNDHAQSAIDRDWSSASARA